MIRRIREALLLAELARECRSNGIVIGFVNRRPCIHLHPGRHNQWDFHKSWSPGDNADAHGTLADCVAAFRLEATR